MRNSREPKRAAATKATECRMPRSLDPRRVGSPCQSSMPVTTQRPNEPDEGVESEWDASLGSEWNERWEKEDEEQFWRAVADADADAKEEGKLPPGGSFDQNGWYRPPKAPSPPKQLPKLVPSSGGPSFSVSAPDIERAVYKLSQELRRTPTDEEIAKELRLSRNRYHEALILLNDIESFVAKKVSACKSAQPSPDLIFLDNGGDAVFCCLRSEILKLFRDAVTMLPERELLVVNLLYGEELSEVEIGVTLDIEESTLTRLRASATLHLRARMFGSRESDRWVSGDSVRPPDPRSGFRNLTGPEAHIYMHGGQSGWLPTGHTWESLGDAANYERYIETYFFINESGEVEPVERTERRKLSVENYRPKRKQ